MTVFETDPRLAVRAGIFAIVVCVLLGAIALATTMALPISLVSVGLAVAALAMFALAPWLGYHTRSLARTSYSLDRNAFVIRYGGLTEVIPMGDAQRLIPAGEVAAELRLRRPPLPGWWIGVGHHPALPPIHFYANAPLNEQVILVTPDKAFGLSPYDVEAFREAFDMRLDMRPTQTVQATLLLPTWLQRPFWRDKAGMTLLIAALALNILVFAVSAARFPLLRGEAPLHFSAEGVADRFGAPAQIFAPASVALALLGLNVAIGFALYRRGEPLGAYLAWGGTIIVQAAFLVAVLTIGFGAA